MSHKNISRVLVTCYVTHDSSGKTSLLCFFPQFSNKKINLWYAYVTKRGLLNFRLPFRDVVAYGCHIVSSYDVSHLPFSITSLKRLALPVSLTFSSLIVSTNFLKINLTM
jgi:hypothetical protein